MARYLQYEKMSGRIVGELVEQDPLPDVYESQFYGYLAVPETLVYDPRAWVVKDGELVRAYETGTERKERKEREREEKEQGIAYLRVLAKEFLFAQLFGDEEEIAQLRQEAEPLKIYWE